MSYPDARPAAARVALAVLLLCCGACSQRWTFAPAEARLPVEPPPRLARLAPEAEQTAAPPIAACSDRAPHEVAAGWTGGPTPSSVVRTPPVDDAVLPAEGRVFDPPGDLASQSPSGYAFDPPPEYAFDPGTAASGDPPAAALDGGTWLGAKFRRAGREIWRDHCNYYSWPTLRDLAIGVALAAPIANTSLDDDFQGWYQRDVRSSGTDHFATFWKTFGEGRIFIPAFAGLAVVGRALEHRPLFAVAGDYTGRVTRGYLVGAPPMLFMQACLGGSRPGETSVGSQWKPFDDTNAVSGHAFVGAVPFITAANMVDRPLLKGGLYVLSAFTAWSRVNDDDHYLSQACLGWWMAYLACRAVDATAEEERCYALAPVATPEMTGIALVWRR